MNSFLTQLPALIATISKALLNALKEQILEIVRLIHKTANWLWSVYYNVETSILGVIADFWLSISALRPIILLLLIGGVFAYFKLWLLLTGYVMFILIAGMRYFEISSRSQIEQAQEHRQTHETIVSLLRIPIRVLTSLIMIYLSWHFTDWRSLNVLWLNQNLKEASRALEAKQEEAHIEWQSLNVPWLHQNLKEAGKALEAKLKEKTASNHSQKTNESWQTDAQKQFNLGESYRNGNGVPQDYTEAAKWHRMAAERGMKESQYFLGWFYGTGKGVPQNNTEAAKWYLMAAKQGMKESQNTLGWYYESGKGVSQDYTEAVKWHRKAAKQGMKESQNSLGWYYKTGKGVPQDYAEAAKWYRMAAEQGLKESQHELGWFYLNGLGVPEDIVEGVKWTRMAAKQGLIASQFNLGLIYETGQGVPRNDAEAVKWYRMAAKKGDAMAQTRLNGIPHKP